MTMKRKNFSNALMTDDPMSVQSNLSVFVDGSPSVTRPSSTPF